MWSTNSASLRASELPAPRATRSSEFHSPSPTNVSSTSISPSNALDPAMPRTIVRTVDCDRRGRVVGAHRDDARVEPVPRYARDEPGLRSSRRTRVHDDVRQHALRDHLLDRRGEAQRPVGVDAPSGTRTGVVPRRAAVTSRARPRRLRSARDSMYSTSAPSSRSSSALADGSVLRRAVDDQHAPEAELRGRRRQSRARGSTARRPPSRACPRRARAPQGARTRAFAPCCRRTRTESRRRASRAASVRRRARRAGAHISWTGVGPESSGRAAERGSPSSLLRRRRRPPVRATWSALILSGVEAARAAQHLVDRLVEIGRRLSLKAQRVDARDDERLEVRALEPVALEVR